MHLYRGLDEEYVALTDARKKETKQKWVRLLQKRQRGDFRYPEELNSLILSLAKENRHQDQFFTDKDKIACRYGTHIIELDVSLQDILRYFTLEFQNFTSRRKQFDLVYKIQGDVLAKHAKKWHLMVFLNK